MISKASMRLKDRQLEPLMLSLRWRQLKQGLDLGHLRSQWPGELGRSWKRNLYFLSWGVVGSHSFHHCWRKFRNMCQALLSLCLYLILGIGRKRGKKIKRNLLEWRLHWDRVWLILRLRESWRERSQDWEIGRDPRFSPRESRIHPTNPGWDPCQPTPKMVGKPNPIEDLPPPNSDQHLPTHSSPHSNIKEVSKLIMVPLVVPEVLDQPVHTLWKQWVLIREV